MILDLNKVQELIDSEITAWKISKDTGLSRNMVTTYKDGKDIKRMTIENGLKLQSYWEDIKKERAKMNVNDIDNKALQNVYFDEGNGTYDLEFLVNGEKHYRQVQASDHPEAATNENYFDDKKVVNRIIMEIPED